MGDTKTAKRRSVTYRPAPFDQILAERGPFGWMNFYEIAAAMGMRYEKAMKLYLAGQLGDLVEDTTPPGSRQRRLRTTVIKMYEYLTGRPYPLEEKKTA